MLGPLRQVPRIGAGARIIYFRGVAEQATVIAVYDGGRRLEVRGEGGQLVEFLLRRATARFVAGSGGQGPRLELMGDASKDDVLAAPYT
jgi:hypothetical protein